MSPYPSIRPAAVRDAGGYVAFHPIARLYVDLARVASAACR